jgi:hypothetical protein
MSWDSDDMKEYKEAQQKRRAERLPVRQQEIEELTPYYNVAKLTDYQYRINGILDLFPIHRRFHNIKTNKRGNYKTIIQIINEQLK